MKIKWTKLKEPLHLELIHEVDLSVDGKIIAEASKDNPVSGVVTHTAYKQIGRNSVCICRFYPDACPNECWVISRKWLRTIRDSKAD